ncbi:MAG: hypothetical protein ACYSX1_00520 [Planctomycetota bacterium]|jgi:hypothetical protein
MENQRALILVVLACLLVFAAWGCSREQRNLSRAEMIKTGVTFKEVYAILGKPDISFGLPQECTKEES